MNTWMALYIKEFKEHKGIFSFLLIATIGADVYALYKIEPQTFTDLETGFFPFLFGLIWALSPFGAVFLLPFILAHSFSTELKAGTHALLLALPVRRSALVLSKFLSVLSVGIVLFTISTGTIHLLAPKLIWVLGLVGGNPGLLDASARESSNLWIFSGSFYFSFLLPLLGLVSAMEGVKYAVVRYRGLAATAFFIGGLYLYYRFRDTATEVLHLPDSYQIEYFDAAGQLQQGQMELHFLVYSTLACLVFLGLGTWLFERHVEG
jgi:ABC-type transport system involved in multi-copper enzyme maturation permease subunit